MEWGEALELWSCRREDKDLRKGTHRFSFGALFTFEASNTRLTLNERDKQVLTLGFSPQSLLIFGSPVKGDLGAHCDESGQKKRAGRRGKDPKDMGGT